ncbi:YqhA family protein, partial [Campylobacter rectus]|uniref:YqhA family protein n=1 Tax=Campylobacter rectus TaxID=203 RepID=UPI0036F3E7C5
MFVIAATTWAHQGLPLLFGKGEHSEGSRSDVVGEIDLYLIALVLYIFSFGIY